MDDITLYQTDSLEYYCIAGNLRTALLYRSREAMKSNWNTVFPDEILPDDHQSVLFEKVEKFVFYLSFPVKGRPSTITGAAQQLAAKIREHKKVALPFVEQSDLFEKVEKLEKGSGDLFEKVEKVATPESLPFLEQSDLFEKVEKVGKGSDDLFEKVEKVPPTFLERCFGWIFEITKLDIVFTVTVAVACYGLVFLLGEMGAAAAIVYAMICFQSLGMAKNRYSQRTATRGIVALWVLEMGAFCVHLTMFNKKMWLSIAEMPFRVEDFGTESRPFWISMALAAVLSLAGIYAVSTTLALVKEKAEAEDFEAQHGIKY